MHQLFAASDALQIPYGSDENRVDVVGAFEEVGIEYATIRKGCVLFDMPHAGTIEVRGTEALEFLNNMVTQRVIDLKPGQLTRSFWLNRKGRVDSDMRIAAYADRTMISLDRHLAGTTANALDGFLFSEDATIKDVSATHHRMALHGVGSLAVLAAATENEDAADLQPNTAAVMSIAGADVLVEREDITGDPGIELCVPRESAAAVYDTLLTLRHDAPKVKQAGWFAINTARIEAGVPLFNTDFGQDNLPMETGVIDSRVDFKKGCYLGQEVVARMDARKVRKRGLVGLRIEPDQDGHAALPNQGDRVFSENDIGGTAIGSVTSSTIAPMVSGACVAFAMLRDKETKPGTKVVVAAEGKQAHAVVQDGLAFWHRK